MTIENKDLLHSLFTWRSYLASENGPKSPVTRHVLLTLSLHMNEKGGSCFPSIDLLQAETGLSRPSIVNHIKIAVNDGWLEKKVLGKNGKGWSRHEYRSTIPTGKNGSKGGLPPLSHCALKKNNSPVNRGGKGDLPRQLAGGKPHSVKAVKEIYSSTSKSPSYTAAKKTGCVFSNKKIPTDHAWFTSWWCFVTEQITGSKYPYKQKDAGQIKQLLKLMGSLENLISRCCVYISWQPQKRFPKGSLTIGGLYLQIAEISDIDDDLYDRFIANGYLPDDSGSEKIILKEFQPWKESNVTATA